MDFHYRNRFWKCNLVCSCTLNLEYLLSPPTNVALSHYETSIPSTLDDEAAMEVVARSAASIRFRFLRCRKPASAEFALGSSKLDM